MDLNAAAINRKDEVSHSSESKPILSCNFDMAELRCRWPKTETTVIGRKFAIPPQFPLSRVFLACGTWQSEFEVVYLFKSAGRTFAVAKIPRLLQNSYHWLKTRSFRLHFIPRFNKLAQVVSCKIDFVKADFLCPHFVSFPESNTVEMTASNREYYQSKLRFSHFR